VLVILIYLTIWKLCFNIHCMTYHGEFCSFKFFTYFILIISTGVGKLKIILIANKFLNVFNIFLQLICYCLTICSFDDCVVFLYFAFLGLVDFVLLIDLVLHIVHSFMVLHCWCC